jgi:imidazolonepropionase-like amidohydrolase
MVDRTDPNASVENARESAMNIKRRFVLAAAAAIVLVSILVHEPLPVDAQGPARIAITGGTLIDGTGSTPLRQAVVVIENGRITAAGPATKVSVPAGATIIDATGQWLVPGLVETHAHFMESGRSYMRPAIIDLTALVPYDQEVSWTKARTPETMARYLCAGVTTVASMGGPRFEREARDYAKSASLAPEVIIAYGPVSVPATPQLAKLFPLFDGDNPVRFAANEREARAEVELAVAEKADLLKTGYLSRGITSPEQTAVFWAEVLPALVSSSAQHRLPVVAHIDDQDSAKRFVRAGVSRFAHVFSDTPVDSEFLELGKEREAILTTTLVTLMRSLEAANRSIRLNQVEERCGDPQVIESWRHLPAALPPAVVLNGMQSALRMAERNVKTLFDAGIALAAGSDAAATPGLLHGASLHQELRLMADAGIPPSAVIVAATRNAARLLGKEGSVGTIQTGRLGDVLLLDKDPTIDIANLGAIRTVIKSGRVYDADKLRP